jgi:hypothetical protein
LLSPSAAALSLHHQSITTTANTIPTLQMLPGTLFHPSWLCRRLSDGDLIACHCPRPYYVSQHRANQVTDLPLYRPRSTWTRGWILFQPVVWRLKASTAVQASGVPCDVCARLQQCSKILAQPTWLVAPQSKLTGDDCDDGSRAPSLAEQSLQKDTSVTGRSSS